MNRPVAQTGSETLLKAALREGWPALLTAAVFSLVGNLLYLAMPIFTNQVYGRVLANGSIATLIVLTAGTVFVFVIVSILDFFRARVLSSFGVVFDQRVSSHVFSALFDGVARRHPSAGAQALRDLDSFRQTLTGAGIGVLFDLPWIPIFMLVLFVIDPAVGALTLFGGIVLVVLAFMQDRSSRSATRASNDAALRGYQFTEAGLRNSEVVRAMGMLPNIGRQWNGHRTKAMSLGLESAHATEFWGNAIKFVRMTIQILIIAMGAYLIVKQEIGGGMLFANMILSSRALAPIERGVATWPSLIAAGQAYERLTALMTDYKPAKSGTKLARPKGALTAEGVNFAAPNSGRLLLTGITFSIQPGQFVGIIGPSGAGKSTLARLLVGVAAPLSGTIRLDGSDVFGWERGDFGSHVGYLPQDTELFSGTVRDNIARFQLDVTDAEVIEAATNAGVHDLIVRLPQGYDTELGPNGLVLSVGQRQRVGLARAMLKNPALVVLDEPNANLDIQGEQALLSALRRLKAVKTTIVVVSHKPSMLEDADALIVLRDGKLDLAGPRAQVMARLAPPAPAVAAPAQKIVETNR